ncbi:MAG: HAD family phosphatase [Dehalococcoidia bacterium]|jgi:HAD superfamily hydrolase (TIGR01509 family)|nr:HAD family phosphatase [Dehalococcoidia bacterium]
MTTFDLVIFDCDGVLVDTETINNEVISQLLNEAGLEMSPEEVARRTTGLAYSEMWEMFEDEVPGSLPVDIEEQQLTLESERFRKELLPIPGVVETVRCLGAAGIPMCVASNGTREKMVVTLEVTGLAGYFGDKFYGVNQVVHGKPAPDIYLLAAQKMGVPPSRCVVIEDSYPGAQAGLAAGMTVLGYCPDKDIWGLEGLGIQTFSDMNVLPELLGVNRG